MTLTRQHVTRLIVAASALRHTRPKLRARHLAPKVEEIAEEVRRIVEDEDEEGRTEGNG